MAASLSSRAAPSTLRRAFSSQAIARAMPTFDFEVDPEALITPDPARGVNPPLKWAISAADVTTRGAAYGNGLSSVGLAAQIEGAELKGSVVHATLEEAAHQRAEFDELTFDEVQSGLGGFLSCSPRVFVADGALGTSVAARHNVAVRVITDCPTTSLAARLLLAPTRLRCPSEFGEGALATVTVVAARSMDEVAGAGKSITAMQVKGGEAMVLSAGAAPIDELAAAIADAAAAAAAPAPPAEGEEGDYAYGAPLLLTGCHVTAGAKPSLVFGGKKTPAPSKLASASGAMWSDAGLTALFGGGIFAAGAKTSGLSLALNDKAVVAALHAPTLLSHPAKVEGKPSGLAAHEAAEFARLTKL